MSAWTLEFKLLMRLIKQNLHKQITNHSLTSHGNNGSLLIKLLIALEFFKWMFINNENCL